MKVLITGGAGFIGSHLCNYLLTNKPQCEITVIDDLSTGRISNLPPNLRFECDTITNRPLMQELIEKSDAVIHLAAAVGVRLIVDNPIHTIETNIQGTSLLLELLAKSEKRASRRVIVISTSEVYGKNVQLPYREDHDLVLGPTSVARWSYACSKAIDEYLTLAYWNQFQLPATIVRLFNTVGPRQVGDYGMVIPRFIQAALRGEDLLVYGDGQQTRSFMHVQDAVHGLGKMLLAPQTHGEVINLGQPEEITIERLARLVIQKCHSRSQIRFVPFQEIYGAGFEDMQRRIPDIGKAQRLIGFEPTLKIDAILDDTIAFFRAEKK